MSYYDCVECGEQVTGIQRICSTCYAAVHPEYSWGDCWEQHVASGCDKTRLRAWSEAAREWVPA